MPASQMAPSQMDRPTGRPYEYGSQVQGGVFGRCAPLVLGHREAVHRHRRLRPSLAAMRWAPHVDTSPHVQLLTGNLDAYSICSAPVFSTSGRA